MRRSMLSIVNLALLALLVGCSKGPTVVPVAGKATVDGAPLVGFVVTFVPDAAKGNKAEVDCSGRLGEDGQYSLQTDDRFDVYKGAPPGWYKVSIWSTEEKPIPINKKYLDTSSPDAISIEVKADAEPGAYDLKFTK